MLRFRFVLVFVALVLVIISGCARLYVFGSNQDDAATVVAVAESELADCYGAVLEAERVGANVSDLLARLNVGAGFLAEAELCYRSGNFSGAVYFAELVIENLDGLIGEAGELYSSVAFERGQESSWVVGVSVVGVFVVVLLGFFGWGYVKGFYVRLVLRMKPEVSDVDES